MSQITLYLDKQTEQQLRLKAKRSGLSLSKWAAIMLKERAKAEWSEELKQLAGCWPDFDEAETVRERLGDDVQREPL
jgi:hypothetical protein